MCGLFGLLCYGDKVDNLNEIIKELAHASAERGIDATGLAYVSNGRLTVYTVPFEYGRNLVVRVAKIKTIER